MINKYKTKRPPTEQEREQHRESAAERAQCMCLCVCVCESVQDHARIFESSTQATKMRKECQHTHTHMHRQTHLSHLFFPWSFHNFNSPSAALSFPSPSSCSSSFSLRTTKEAAAGNAIPSESHVAHDVTFVQRHVKSDARRHHLWKLFVECGIQICTR